MLIIQSPEKGMIRLATRPGTAVDVSRPEVSHHVKRNSNPALAGLTLVISAWLLVALPNK